MNTRVNTRVNTREKGCVSNYLLYIILYYIYIMHAHTLTQWMRAESVVVVVVCNLQVPNPLFLACSIKDADLGVVALLTSKNEHVCTHRMNTSEHVCSRAE